MRGQFINWGTGLDNCHTINMMEIPFLDLKGQGEGVLSGTWIMLKI